MAVSPDPLHDAGTLIAQAVKKSVDPHSGFKYAPAGDTAIRALVEAGWTPPGEDGDTETERLHRTVASQQAEVARVWEHTYRIEAEREAAREFRTRFLDLMWQLQQQLTAAKEAARADREPEPTYTAEQVLGWLRRILDLSDKAEGRTKAKELEKKPTSPPTVPPAAVQGGLFDIAPDLKETA